MSKGLTARQLKTAAVAAMVTDHLAGIAALLPIGYTVMRPLLFIMNLIGRFTIPIMCFFIAEGFYHTRSIKKYLLRLFVFALISQAPFFLYEHGLRLSAGNLLHFNVIYTLFWGLLALTVWKSERTAAPVKVICAAALSLLTFKSDWRLFAVLWILAFGIFRGSFKKQAAAFILISVVRVLTLYIALPLLSASRIAVTDVILQSSTVLALIPLYFYNGSRGGGTKYGFYIFYPAHLTVLGIIKLLIAGG